VSFSYLITLDLYSNANEQEDYESCINSHVLTRPKQFCKDFIGEHPVFNVWNSTDKDNVCIEVGQAVTTTCGDSKSCDACAVAMAEIYQEYE
jgi:hypothetical protein